MSGIACPVCNEAELDTVTTAPYIRGMLLAYTFGTKRFVGCSSCVRKQLAGEVGLSLVAGWFSLTAIVVNPMCILWNGVRVPFIKANPMKVQELLAELGVDTSPSGAAAQVDITRVAASLAVAMVAADGDVDEDEIVVSVGIGQRLFEDFTPELFRDVLVNADSLPNTTQLAAVLRDYLTDDGKIAVQKYLIAIACADGRIDPAEIELLRSVSYAFGLEPPDLKPGPCEKPF
jgi:uncharacterized tellurite resistance protein B-like protein